MICSRVQNFMGGSTNNVFRLFDKLFRKFVKYHDFYYGGFISTEFTQHSTGLLLRNQVDGLPGSLHTEAVWAPHGSFESAPIDKLDQQKIEND